MDYRRPLFQLEQWSPFLAKKVWGLTSAFDGPLNLALGFRVKNLSDLNAEIEIPFNRLTRGESGDLSASVLIAGGEFVSKTLWLRHLTPGQEALRLQAVHCRFLKGSQGPVRARTELHEPERERVLRKLRIGEESDCDMSVIFVDARDQQIAGLNCVWRLIPQRPLALGAGQI